MTEHIGDESARREAIHTLRQDVSVVDQINALRHEYDDADGGGWLSTLVWNVRNAYSAWPDGTTENQAVRKIVEGFLTEIERIKAEQIDG